MELNKQIKKYRMDMNLSQEELADKIYVTRQTISNWETNKNYPDIHSLLLMSTLFCVSLDQLIKGDLEMMKKEIKEEERNEYNNYAKIFSLLLISMVLVTAPLVFFFKIYGFIVIMILFIITLYFALKVEKFKKRNDIQTYREIIAFSNGECLDEIAKSCEQGKRPYQKVLIPLGFGVGAFIVIIVMLKILDFLS